MLQAGEAAAQEAGISNVRTVQSTWPAAGLEGDLLVSFNVAFFVRDIEPFLQGLVNAARRQVILGVRGVPTPNRYADFFQLVYREPLAPLPTYRELLPVLWDQGILPEVHVVTEVGPVAKTPQDAVDEAVRGVWLHPDQRERARSLLTDHFDELFAATEHGYEPRLGQDARNVLITWNTADL
jgi:hypothetical protein